MTSTADEKSKSGNTSDVEAERDLASAWGFEPEPSHRDRRSTEAAYAYLDEISGYNAFLASSMFVM